MLQINFILPWIMQNSTFFIEKMEFYCFPTAMCLLRGKVHINYYDQIAEIQQQIIYMIEVTKDNHLESF